MKKPTTQDAIYVQPREAITDFVFDESVVQVFEDMVSRSVPAYSTLLSMIPVLVRRYVQAQSRCYDLGCSLGAATLAMRHSINQPGVSIHSIDNSPAMVKQCKDYVDRDSSSIPVAVECADIGEIDIQQASMVVMNFTMQFIDREERLALSEKIYQGMKPGGIFLLSEKILFEDAQRQGWMTELHHEFKKANGYSELEISQKRSALENVLLPESISTHQMRLSRAGFKQSMVWFQCFNFVSLLAIK